MPKKKVTEKKPVGRPPAFTPEILEKVLDLISDGETERSVFRREALPAWRTWTKFKRENAEFIPQLLRAKEDYCEVKEDEIYLISRDTTGDLHKWIETTDGPRGRTVKQGVTSDNTSVQRHRLQIDAIWKLLRSTMPRKYGEHIQQELTGKDGADLVPVLNITIAPPVQKKDGG